MIRAALEWLYDIDQPDDAVVSHHGAHVGVDGRFRYQAVPRGYAGYPVIVIDVLKPEWGPKGTHAAAVNAITQAEVNDIAVAIAAMGGQVVDQWNGAGYITGSFSLGCVPNPSLLAALDRYQAGCPEHGTVFCSRDGCKWLRDGAARVVPPNASDVDRALQATPGGSR